MIDIRHLSILIMIASVLAKTKLYIDQKPSDDYLNRFI